MTTTRPAVTLSASQGSGTRGFTGGRYVKGEINRRYRREVREVLRAVTTGAVDFDEADFEPRALLTSHDIS